MKSAEIKCVVWDLDGTLWDGTLLEAELADQLSLRAEVREIIETLDRRGILQSVCSKNDFQPAYALLERLGVAAYFLFPRISWEAKSAGIKRIQEQLNIGLDAIAFVDDQAFERDEVRAALPDVLCLDAAGYKEILSLPRMQPRFVTDESKERRALYRTQIQRDEEEERYGGTPESFLSSLGLRFRIARAVPADIPRVEELTVRTNQLNTTGIVYGAEELMNLCESDEHLVLVCDLEDRYGSYGKVGVALIEIRPDAWVVRLFVMSCRVVSRGVGSVFLSHIARRCREAGKRLIAHFRHTDRNRMMFVTYRFLNFKEVTKDAEGLVVLENDLSTIAAVPPHIELVAEA